MWKSGTCLVLLLIFAFAYCQNKDSSEVVKDTLKKKKGDGCGHTYDGLTGSFHLNVSYLPGKECTWHISPKPDNQTKATSLFLHTLFLHENDTINIYATSEDAKNNTNPILDPPIRANNGSITVVTDLLNIVVKLTGISETFNRTCEAMYDARSLAIFNIPPAVSTIYSPIHSNRSANSLKCAYQWNKDQHFLDTTSTFIFEQFNFSTSTVTFEKSSLETDVYKNDPQMDIFPTGNPMVITVDMILPTNETFRLRKHDIDAGCSKLIKIGDHVSEKFESPEYVLNNGSIIPECRWIFSHNSKDKVLSVDFQNLHFDSALDIIAINNGASELSPPLLQVTTSNKNFTLNEIIRSHGSYLWIAFKPTTFNSKILGQVSEHGEGGYFKGSGKIECAPAAGNNTVFQLEVESDQIVYLNFTSASLVAPGALSIYDGFDKSNLLATLRDNVWYPVLSQTSKMMIIASDFGNSRFTAEFKGVKPGCLHMSTMTNDNYILSGNCNTTCLWVVPPQNLPASELLLTLQYISLAEGDTIDISRLDANKTRVGITIDANMTHVPQLVIPSSVGAIVEINRVPCSKGKDDDTILVGHSSYVPVCGKNLSVAPMTEFQITSPLYPDTYPIFASCLWKISTPKENLVHLAFNTLNLAPNHCIKVHSSSNETQQYSGSELPEDLFLSGDSTVEFDSSNCGKPVVSGSFQSASGFVVNGTVADCGGVLKEKSGEFSIPANKTFCVWKVSVPDTDSTANSNVNIITYAVSKKDATENYVLNVYDGSSIREPLIINGTNVDVWSRTNNLIFIYKKTDASKPSSILSVKYSTISCNSSSQCDNHLCLHPDWRCDGKNDCGDFSDERNCASVPIPPQITLTGFSSLAFWLTTFIMLATGIFLGATGPYCYQRYKNGQYRRFGDFSVVQ